MTVTEHAFPDLRAKVTVTARNKTLVASLPVTHGGLALVLSVSCQRDQSRATLSWDGVPFTAGIWRHGRFALLTDADASVAETLPPTMLLHQAIGELEIALVRAERDPSILAAAGAHPVELVRAGARPKGFEDPALRGVVAKEIGDVHEHEATAMTRRVLADAPWVTGVRRATLDEDRRGLDIIVSTVDAGELYVQVKSSPAAAADYRRKYQTAITFSRTVVVVVGPGAEYSKTQGILRNELQRLYKVHGGKLPLVAEAPPPAKESREAANRRAVAEGDFSSLRGIPQKQLELMLELQRVALAREEEKTRRHLLAQDHDAYRDALRVALRYAVSREAEDEAAAKVVAEVRARWPRWLNPAFLNYEGKKTTRVDVNDEERVQMQAERKALVVRKSALDTAAHQLRQGIASVRTKATKKRGLDADLKANADISTMEFRLAEVERESGALEEKIRELLAKERGIG